MYETTQEKMMTDRELLKLAAIACGELKGEWIGNENYFDGVLSRWNPLTDDGDALRLAVKFEIVVEYRRDKSVAFAYNYARHMEVWQNNENLDPYAATRRAIVRAAAEIGKAM